MTEPGRRLAGDCRVDDRLIFGRPVSGMRRGAWFVSAPEVPTFGCLRLQSLLRKRLVPGPKGAGLFCLRCRLGETGNHSQEKEPLGEIASLLQAHFCTASGFQCICRTPTCRTTALRDGRELDRSLRGEISRRDRPDAAARSLPCGPFVSQYRCPGGAVRGWLICCANDARSKRHRGCPARRPRAASG